MNRRRWIDKWVSHDLETKCSCGHTLGQHPADRFRSCSRCVWCDDFRYRPIPLSWHSAADQMGLNDDGTDP